MATKTNKAIKISQKHLLGIQELSINDVKIILDEASKFIDLNRLPRTACHFMDRIVETNYVISDNGMLIKDIAIYTHTEKKSIFG